MRRLALVWSLCALVAGGSACSETESTSQPMFRVPELDLEIPKLSGWVIDPAIKAEDPAKGGVIFRLSRESAVPLSPRIDVYLEPMRTQPTLLEDFLTQNLRDMAQLESSRSIRITQVDQRPIALGPRRAFHVLHEYAMLSPGQAPIAITQLSTIMVIDGRGVAVSAAGRTELFHPLADSIERILTGLALPVPKGGARPRRPPPSAPATTPAPAPGGHVPTIVEPLDLGKVGGKQ
jgi:hypothetical protein